MEGNTVSQEGFPDREQRVFPEGPAGDLEEGPESSEGSGSDWIGKGDAPGAGRARELRSSACRKKRGSRPAKVRRHPVYSFEFKLRVVKLHIEEGLGVQQISEESGISQGAVFRWVKEYREHGETALLPSPAGTAPGREQCPQAVKDQIVALKQAEPSAGVKRISQVLRRWLHLPASPETVRRTLHEHGLLESKPVRAPRAPTKPRFFERTTPNQLWQSDIFTFRLGGKNAYLIGYIDDYSRFLVSLGLFRSQTAEHVLETYRRAVGEYGVPREMLTDNGRQYASWRGVTKFEQELKKDKVHHIRSRPHHPMTLGKVERFWKNIHGEFLCRAQFDSFEQAQERVRLWLKYYNHRRPHQGIGGLCPADRFFEIRNDLRQVMERGLEENLLETALRGKPRRPFYMVGRLDGQSVTLQALKGKLVMTVDDERTHQQQEVVCDLENGEMHHENDRNPGAESIAAAVHGGGEMPVGAGVVDGAGLGLGDLQADGRDLESAQPVAGTGDGGDAAGALAETEGAEREHAAQCPAAGAPGAAGGPGGPGNGRELRPGPDPSADLEALPEAGADSAGAGDADGAVTEPPLSPEVVERVLRLLLAGCLPAGYRTAAAAAPPPSEDVVSVAVTGEAHDRRRCETASAPGNRSPDPAPDAAAAGGAQRQDDGRPGGAASRRLAQDLVRVAVAGNGSPAPGAVRPGHGPAASAPGPGEGRDAQGTGTPGNPHPPAGGGPARPHRPA